VPLKWNDLNPEREPALPIDDSDGGWEGPLEPGPAPQTHQHEALTIAPEDAIGDGADVFCLIQQRGIDNVILMGVHTNKCILGRPFGIRQMVYLGKNLALMRDMTDSLYNPERPPNVSHFRGTELVIEHIETYWCPTITSTDLLNKPAFRFAEDKRPHVAFIVSDDHYDADKTLPRFAQMLREEHGIHCTVLHGQGKPDIPHTAELQTADVMVLFVRRLGLPADQLAAIREYVYAGNPLVALRTASHAFKMNYRNPRGFKVPEGCAEWPEFDADVLGGNYHNHAANELGTDVNVVPEARDHPILANVVPTEWHSTGSLYYVSPVAEDAAVLMRGAIPDHEEPLTWVRTYRGGRVVYTGLGHPDDFDQPQFVALLVNAIHWAMGKPVPGT
jgi:type 1 glutamine amidotransferase